MIYPIRRLLLVTVFISLCSPSGVRAGGNYELTCKTEACQFKQNATFGGGIIFEQVTGYCVRDEHFVHVTWVRGEKPPEPVRIFDAQTGNVIEMYRCPECRDPFLPIQEARDVKYCPRCHRPSLEYRLIGFLD